MAPGQRYYRPPRPQYPPKGQKPVAGPQRPQQQQEPRPIVKNPKPKGPPVPKFIISSIGFVVLLMSGIVLSYYCGVFQYFLFISYMMLILALILAAHSVFGIFFFNRDHRTEDPRRCMFATVAVVGILVGGSVMSAVLFVELEPYHDWEYTAELKCKTSCIVDLPVPVKAPNSNRTFFSEKDLSTKGQGFVQIVDRFPENKKTPALRVHWSGNFSIKASMSRDYRDLLVGRNGLYNASAKEFVVYGLTVPVGDNVTFRLELEHKKISQTPYKDHWVIQGKIELGTNYYSVDNS
jgi:hypothetical protein